MTARVTTLKGSTAGAYYVEVLPNYYLASGEPKGRWLGKGSELLGLRGEVDDQKFLNVMAGTYPDQPEMRLGRAYNDESVRGFDVTASAPKSVSVLFAVEDDETRQIVLGAHDTAVAAMVGWVEDHAHTRHRINGEVATVDAEGIIAATFRQHTSRALDPQIHTHVVIANKVRSPDGRWLALDARTLKMDQRTLSSIYHVVLRSELTNNLGVNWRPVENGIAEIDNMPDEILREFSTRTTAIQQRLDQKLDRFVDTFERQPTPRERWKLEREAVLDSRPSKSHALSARALHAGWIQQVEALGYMPDGIVKEASKHVHSKRLTGPGQRHIVETALAALEEKQSTWRPAELTRELAAAVPTKVGLPAGELVGFLDGLTRWVIEEHCVDISRPILTGVAIRKDGRPVTESAVDRALTTPAILAQEERLMEWAQRRMAIKSTSQPEAVRRSAEPLTMPQAEVAATVAGDAQLVLVVGPAGTGKTTALAPAVAQLQADGRTVFGVAPSAAAADVLGTETGIDADTIDKLLIEHRLTRPPCQRYDLPSGTTVIVDEAGMVATGKLDQLATLADSKRWRVALVGDPQQFSAVGRGGMFGHLIDTQSAIELDQVHRFTNPWERSASLQMRRGDTAVAEIYEHFGRLHGGTSTRMESGALDRWWGIRQQGDFVVLSAPFNEAVHRLNQSAQQRRIDSGELAADGLVVVANDYQIRQGDEIVTRSNNRDIRTDRGLMIRNRDQWIVQQAETDGGIHVAGRGGAAHLPAHYVAEFVELAYAQTSHASQGRTVDHSILVLDGPADVRGVYVPMTRGRHSNHAYVVTQGEQTAVDVFAAATSSNWIDQPAVARRSELAGQSGLLSPERIRELWGQREALTDRIREVEFGLVEFVLRYDEMIEVQAERLIERQNMDGELATARTYLEENDRWFRRHGRHDELAAARRTVDHLPTELRWLTNELDERAERIQSGKPYVEELRQAEPKLPAIRDKVAALDSQLERDVEARHAPGGFRHDKVILGVLGKRPDSDAKARMWDQSAGQIDQHHAAFGNTRGMRFSIGIIHKLGLRSSHQQTERVIERATPHLDLPRRTREGIERTR